MKRIFSAIARSLSTLARSVSRTTWRFCTETGKWIATTIAGLENTGGSSATQTQAVDEVPDEVTAEYATAADLVQSDDGKVDALIRKSQKLLSNLSETISAEYSYGDDYDRLQRICKARAEGLEPWHFDYFKLIERHQDWLGCLTPEMDAVVADASREELIAHMKGGKGLRGVVRSDAESIAGWRRACELEEAQQAYEVESYDAGQPEWAQGRMAAC